MSAHIASSAQDDFTGYMELVQTFPLRPIRDDQHLEAAGEVLDQLLDLEEISEGQQDYLDVLAGLIREYEDARRPMPSASGVDVLRFLMEEHGLRQTDLGPVLGSKSLVSEILQGKRKLNLNHIRRLSQHFNVPADAFIETSANGK